MGAVRQTKAPRVLALVLASSLLACGERPAVANKNAAVTPPAVTPAAVTPVAAQPFDHFESAEGKFAIDFPAVWKGHYTAVPHADTTAGSHYIVEFRFKPDPGSNVEPRTLMAIRIFTAAAWARVAAMKGQSVGILLKKRGDDAYVFAVAGSNPYNPEIPAATLFEQMVLSVTRDSVPLRLTPR
jgi:hypothetical protein